MKSHSEFIDYLLELMQPVGDISAKAMFGGYGIYHAGTMFALVADDVLYFKTGELNQEDFEARELPAFRYRKGDKTISMSYHEAPGEVYDDPDEMTVWARAAIAEAEDATR